eukprot:5010679-Pleurochrysis_carterae.AAC.1
MAMDAPESAHAWLGTAHTYRRAARTCARQTLQSWQMQAYMHELAHACTRGAYTRASHCTPRTMCMYADDEPCD